MSIYTTEAELYDIFTKFGPLKKATVVIDAKVGFDPEYSVECRERELPE